MPLSLENPIGGSEDMKLTDTQEFSQDSESLNF